MSVIDEAVVALRMDKLVVIPTDTVYGLAGRADLADAVQAIFEVKGRPKDRALPVLGAGIDDLRAVATFSDEALVLAERFALVTATGPVSPSSSRARGCAGTRTPTVS